MLTAVVAVEFITPITTMRAVGLTVGTIAVITLAACPPQIRQIEGVMVTALLGADIGQQPSPSRNTEETLGSVLWFWLHLLAGTINGAALVVPGVGGVLATLSPITLDPGTEIVGISP